MKEKGKFPTGANKENGSKNEGNPPSQGSLTPPLKYRAKIPSLIPLPRFKWLDITFLSFPEITFPFKKVKGLPFPKPFLPIGLQNPFKNPPNSARQKGGKIQKKGQTSPNFKSPRPKKFPGKKDPKPRSKGKIRRKVWFQEPSKFLFPFFLPPWKIKISPKFLPTFPIPLPKFPIRPPQK